jgi:hypothetical protein
MTDPRVLAELMERHPYDDEGMIDATAKSTTLGAAMTFRYAVLDLVQPLVVALTKVAAAITRALTRR